LCGRIKTHRGNLLGYELETCGWVVIGVSYDQYVSEVRKTSYSSHRLKALSETAFATPVMPISTRVPHMTVV
jgi:hypothetical protein